MRQIWVAVLCSRGPDAGTLVTALRASRVIFAPDVDKFIMLRKTMA